MAITHHIRFFDLITVIYGLSKKKLISLEIVAFDYFCSDQSFRIFFA
jgi:hypothetical protein